MASLVNKLESNEAILLMYLADELGPEDRAEVEQMLAGDRPLREQLASLRDLQGFVKGQLGETQVGVGAVSDEAAVRRVMRAVRQQGMEAMCRPAAGVALWRGWPRWTYAVAAAAAAVFIMISLWGMGAFEMGGQNPMGGGSVPVARDDETGEALATAPLEERWLLSPAGGERLNEASLHAAELQASEDDEALVLML